MHTTKIVAVYNSPTVYSVCSMQYQIWDIWYIYIYINLFYYPQGQRPSVNSLKISPQSSWVQVLLKMGGLSTVDSCTGSTRTTKRCASRPWFQAAFQASIRFLSKGASQLDEEVWTLTTQQRNRTQSVLCFFSKISLLTLSPSCCNCSFRSGIRSGWIKVSLFWWQCWCTFCSQHRDPRSVQLLIHVVLPVSWPSNRWCSNLVYFNSWVEPKSGQLASLSKQESKCSWIMHDVRQNSESDNQPPKRRSRRDKARHR